MGKSWMGFLLLLSSLGFALSSGAAEATTLEKLYQIKLKLPSKIVSFALGSQKPYLAVVHPGQGKGTWTILAWRSDSRIPIYRETLRGYAANEPAPVVCFSPDDAWLAIGVQTQVRLVDTTSWKVAAELERTTTLAPVVRASVLAFSADGKQLMVRYMVPTAPVEQQPAVPYDLESQRPLRTHILTGPIDYLALVEVEGPWFATVERHLGLKPWFVVRRHAEVPDEINRWQLTSPANPLPEDPSLWVRLHYCQGPEECVQIVGVSASGGRIRGVFLDSTGKTLGVWEGISGGFERVLTKSAGGRPLASVALRAPRAAAFVPASPSPALVLWDLESGKEILRKELAAGEARWRGLALSADGQYLVAQDGAASLTVYAIKK